jgi:pyruvate,water dikinase
MGAPGDNATARIVRSSEASSSSIGLLGGKAFHLAQLGAAGLPVPPWFCVTTAVFHAVFGGITADAPSPLTGADRNGLRSAAKRINAAVKTMRLPDPMLEELYGAFDALFPPHAVVAVRSSAVGEDSAKDSFAGQLDTYLYVTREALPERVLACFASAFSERALLYRRVRGGDLTAIEAAVVVQLMAEARAAGVMFTANPTTGARDEAVISAAFGLGEGVVAGLVESDTFFLDLHTGAVRERRIAQKHSQITLDTSVGAGTRAVAVPPAFSRVAVLDDPQLVRLAELGRQVQAVYGSPQDIEWAIDESGKIHLLQSRPITTLGRERESIFDNANVVESYPGLSLPLTFSYARNGYTATFRESLRLLGVPPGVLAANATVHENLVALLNGRIYYNLLSWYRMFEIGGFEWMLPAWERALGLPKRFTRTSQPTLSQRVAGLRVKLSFVWHLFRIHRSIQAFSDRFRELLADFQRRDLTAMDAHDLLDLHDSLARGIRGPYGISVVNDALTQQLHSLLGKLISRFELGGGTETGNALLCGETGMESVEPVRSGLQLAEHIRGDPQLLALFEGTTPAAGVWAEIHGNARFAGFREKLARHLALYGDRTLHELKLETPPAEDNPEFVVAILRNYLRGGQDPAAMHKREQQIRKQAEESVARRLRGHFLRRWLFRWVLERVRRGTKNRENLRLARSRAFGMSKRIYRALGARLAEKKLISAPSDVFYLSEEEIAGAVRGHALTQDLRGLVELRKREYDRFRAIESAGRIVTSGIVAAAPLATAAAASPGEVAGVLQGQGCSPGRVAGKAKIVSDPTADFDVNGEILIAPMTDPGWVFLMVASKGLVSEKGSLLSHTAIIGRELGIPTVVGVKDATRLIQSGQTVEIDGDAGTVRIIADQSRDRE